MHAPGTRPVLSTAQSHMSQHAPGRRAQPLARGSSSSTCLLYCEAPQHAEWRTALLGHTHARSTTMQTTHSTGIPTHQCRAKPSNCVRSPAPPGQRPMRLPVSGRFVLLSAIVWLHTLRQQGVAAVKQGCALHAAIVVARCDRSLELLRAAALMGDSVSHHPHQRQLAP